MNADEITEAEDPRPFMSEPWHLHARVAPSSLNPGKLTLTLGVSECEAYADFDPSHPVAPTEADPDAGRSDVDDRDNFAAAVAKTARTVVEAALEQEAYHWANEHDAVYVVWGLTGDGEDRQEWEVRAFLNEDHARRFEADLNGWLESHGLRYGGRTAEVVDPHGDLVKCPLDPDFRVDRTGTTYQTVKIPLDATHAWA